MLKQLIQRLLDSRTTPAQAGHNTMPVNIAEAIDIFLAVGSEGSYTAPADGYLSAMVEPGGNMNFWGQILPISSFPIQNVQGKLFVPMAKGMEVRYFINGTVSLSKFLKTIGGGYNLFIWRALPCLRALSNCLLRSFCKAKSLGLEINPSHHLQKLPSLLRTGLNTRLLRTAGFESEVNQLRRQRCMLQWLPFLQEMVQLYVMCPSERVRLSFATSAHTQDKQTASLFPLSVLANLQTGGALC